jgi:putative PIN family toxin of toxin-antitoxin system
MRVVIDTNVLVSGVFFGGNPGRVLDAWRDGSFELVVSPEIVEEYRRVGARLAEQFDGVTLGPFLALLVTHAEIVEPVPLPRQVSRDPTDDMFLACAVTGGCRYIISGDNDLLDVSSYRKIKIVTPRDFLDSALG